MNKTAIFLAPEFEEIEALAVVDLLRRADIEIDMVSISVKYEVTGSHGITVYADRVWSEVNFEDIDMIILPGGPGTKRLEACEPLLKQIKEFYKNGKYISAICAAPSILGHLGMLKGRNACSFPTYESQLEGAIVTQSQVEVSDHIITSRGMGCAIPFGLAIVERFKGKETAERLAEKIVFKKEEN